MRLSSLFIFLVSALCLQGQDNSLDTIVVQTTQIHQPIKQTGRNITVIQSEEIQSMSFTSLDDLLQYIPGIEVQSRNGYGAQGDITMRGATYTQVLVLVNGMKQNDPLTGHFNSSIPVTPSEIERIEVLRGAASAIYGADAVGGVINIITKGFTNASDDRNTFEGNLNYGKNGLVTAQQGFSIRKKKYFIGGGFSMNQSDGEIIPGVTIDTSTSLEEYRNYFDIKTVGLSAGYQFNDQWNLKVRSAYDDRDFAARYFYTNSSFDKSTEQTRNWWNQIQLSNIKENASTDIQFAYRYGTDKFIFSPDFPSTNEHSTGTANLNIHHLRIINERLSLKFGLQGDQRWIKSTDRGDHENIHFGTYAMAAYTSGSGLNLTGSIRLDYDDNYDFQFSPQLNASKVWNNFLLRASIGRSIRAADYTERFVSYNLDQLTPGRSLGNPNLAAESAWSEEVGVDWNFSKQFKIKATAFSRQSNNLIDYVPTLADDIERNSNLTLGSNYFFAQNITAVQTSGIELETWLTKSLGLNKSLNWSVGYTFLNTSNEADVISVYISSHARHLLTTNFLLTADKLNWSITGRYKMRNEAVAEGISAELAPSYMVWNTKLRYELFEHFGIQLQVSNIFDEQYADFLGAKMPGRWMTGGIGVRF